MSGSSAQSEGLKSATGRAQKGIEVQLAFHLFGDIVILANEQKHEGLCVHIFLRIHDVTEVLLRFAIHANGDSVAAHKRGGTFLGHISFNASYTRRPAPDNDAPGMNHRMSLLEGLSGHARRQGASRLNLVKLHGAKPQCFFLQ
ncbi:uncharacterized protein MCYG_00472 [Microsporum canis CBS 113480]|uniref:Uncharacterized protein n=1 Tax=Arthroderma otae (strain ATCC MYA-4605 / CBS 113480) TaxID=554155 RepID=C5FCQ0_ARTOC|nr:uncharacterized protein MCYG_00472 [Microsporum canis CBS 113480]EEQ27584.1 predicted protein [Microsporum canis CBS 113480]